MKEIQQRFQRLRLLGDIHQRKLQDLDEEYTVKWNGSSSDIYRDGIALEYQTEIQRANEHFGSYKSDLVPSRYIDNVFLHYLGGEYGTEAFFLLPVPEDHSRETSFFIKNQKVEISAAELNQVKVLIRDTLAAQPVRVTQALLEDQRIMENHIPLTYVTRAIYKILKVRKVNQAAVGREIARIAREKSVLYRNLFINLSNLDTFVDELFPRKKRKA